MFHSSCWLWWGIGNGLYGSLLEPPKNLEASDSDHQINIGSPQELDTQPEHKPPKICIPKEFDPPKFQCLRICKQMARIWLVPLLPRSGTHGVRRYAAPFLDLWESDRELLQDATHARSVPLRFLWAFRISSMTINHWTRLEGVPSGDDRHGDDPPNVSGSCFPLPKCLEKSGAWSTWVK